MRKTRNAAIIAAVSLGTVFGTSSVALADGASANESEVEAGISPNSQSATQAGPATLFSQVQTYDNTGGPLTIVDKAAEQVFIDFDDDLTIDGTAVPTCDTPIGGATGLNTKTTEQVVTACSDAIVGSGQAEALVPTGVPAQPVSRLELTITSLNGPTTTAGGPCTPPGDGVGGPAGCAFQGGLPQIYLHAYNQPLAFITTVQGEIQDSPDTTADYGSRLAVTDAPDTAGDAGSLILFNSTVGASTQTPTSDTDTSKKKKKKGKKTIITITKTITNGFDTSNYVSATCGDDAANGGKEYDFKGTWVYDDASTDTDTFKQKCGNPAP